MQGIRSARLPIALHMQLTGTQILTVNQVFAILLGYLHEGSWAEALTKAVPERKRGKAATAEQDEEDASGDLANELAVSTEVLAENSAASLTQPALEMDVLPARPAEQAEAQQTDAG